MLLPEPDAWWHSPEAAGCLWGAVLALTGAFIRAEVVLRSIRKELDFLQNGGRIGKIEAKQTLIWDLLKSHFRLHGE